VAEMSVLFKRVKRGVWGAAQSVPQLLLEGVANQNYSWTFLLPLKKKENFFPSTCLLCLP